MTTITNTLTNESRTVDEDPRNAVTRAWQESLGTDSRPGFYSPWDGWAPTRFRLDAMGGKLAVSCGDWTADLCADPAEQTRAAMIESCDQEIQARRVVLHNRTIRDANRRRYLMCQQARLSVALFSMFQAQPKRVAV